MHARNQAETFFSACAQLLMLLQESYNTLMPILLSHFKSRIGTETCFYICTCSILKQELNNICMAEAGRLNQWCGQKLRMLVIGVLSHSDVIPHQ